MPDAVDVPIDAKLLAKKSVTIRSVDGIEWQCRAWLTQEQSDSGARWRIVVIRGYLKLFGDYATLKAARTAFEALTLIDDNALEA